MDSPQTALIAKNQLQDLYFEETNGKMNIFYANLSQLNIKTNSDGKGHLFRLN